MLDASVTLAWCFPDEQSSYADKVLKALVDGHAFVPALWALEVANALLVGERRKRLTRQDVTQFSGLLDGLSVETDSQTAARAMSETLELARAHSLSAYDAAYLELAMRLGAELATTDLPLRRAAKAVGTKVFA